MPKTVVVAMSGGVDSSVVAAMMNEQGHKVIGITLQLYDHGAVLQKKGACCAGQDIYDAKMVADRIGIPHYVLNYENLFRQKVIDDFVDSYARGETPLPCVRCNQSVKFKDLLKFAKELGVKSVYVLNDTETYGQGVAQAFVTEAKKQGIKVLSSGDVGEGWDKKQTDYTALFTKIKATKPDMVYFGGIFDNNGGQLTKDKVKVLGDNTKVKLMGPDGFTGYPAFNSLPEADGTYLSFAGLSTDLLLANDPTGAGAKFVKSYKKAYGKDPVGSYPLYGVAAVQVILAAIAKSDGSRKGVNNAVFSGSGISIPAKQSVLGKELKISTLTGDTLAKDITIEVIKNNDETTLKAWTVK